MNKKEEEIKQEFYRVWPHDGLQGKHGAMSDDEWDDPYRERGYYHDVSLQPIPARQNKEGCFR